MISPSLRAREAIKTALAMTIAYGIALAMDWDRAYWAGFAVAFISLGTAGQSIHKGVMRMLGTLVGGAVALLFIALFSQERWWMMLALTPYIAYCTYMAGGQKNPYTYQVAGFVCAIIVFDGGANSLNAFGTAVIRILETGTGVLVYTLVTLFLWPLSSRGELFDTAQKLVQAQHGLFRGYRGVMTGNIRQQDLQAERRQEMGLVTRLAQALNGAETDSYEVWEARMQWRSFQRLSNEMLETLERWRESFPEVGQLDLNKLFPNLDAFFSELDARFAQTGEMLAGRPPDRSPQAISLEWDPEAIAGLSHFQKAALANNRAQLHRLEALSRSLFDCVRDVKGFTGRFAAFDRTTSADLGLALDIERTIAAVRGVFGMWLAFLLWVYVDPPNGSGVVTFSVSLGMAVALLPQIRLTMLFLPIVLSILFAGVLYLFVMPHLSGFSQLGLMIFVTTFGIGYLFDKPQQALAKAFGLAFFCVITSISNDQTYSFVRVADTMTMSLLVIAVLIVAAYVPVSPRPEKNFLRLVKRFFRQSEFIMSSLPIGRDRPKGPLVRWKMMLYRNDLLELPQKLEVWGRMIDHRILPDTSAEQVRELIDSLHALAYRIKDLVEAREQQQAAFLVRELLQDVRDWRVAIEQIFQNWAQLPTTDDGGDLGKRLQIKRQKMEQRISETMANPESKTLSAVDYENFYRLLGSFRGLSETLVNYATVVNRMSLSQWRESRF